MYTIRFKIDDHDHRLAIEIAQLSTASGDKIRAIKLYRALTGKGLKEAKELIYKYWGEASTPNTLDNPRPGLTPWIQH